MSDASPGRLVALEGVDGCGKTTQAARLADALGAVSTHEPGATPLGAALRRMLLLDVTGTVPVPRAEALLMAADRAQHVAEIVRPALAEGRWVVTDRFSGSTLAYQGYGRGLEIDGLRRLVDWAAEGIEPDLSIVIDVEPATARARLESVAPDRLERLDDEFFTRVRDGYLALAGEDPQRWAVVDGDRSPKDVAASVLETVRARLGDATAVR